MAEKTLRFSPSKLTNAAITATCVVVAGIFVGISGRVAFHLVNKHQDTPWAYSSEDGHNYAIQYAGLVTRAEATCGSAITLCLQVLQPGTDSDGVDLSRLSSHDVFVVQAVYAWASYRASFGPGADVYTPALSDIVAAPRLPPVRSPVVPD